MFVVFLVFTTTLPTVKEAIVPFAPTTIPTVVPTVKATIFPRASYSLQIIDRQFNSVGRNGQAILRHIIVFLSSGHTSLSSAETVMEGASPFPAPHLR
jgi:hypothetical protein